MNPNHGLRGPLAEHVVTERVGEPGPDGSIVVSLRFSGMGSFTAKLAAWLGLFTSSLPSTITLCTADTGDIVRLFLDDVPPVEAAERFAGMLGA